MKKKGGIATVLWWVLCSSIVVWTAVVQVFQTLPSYDDTGYVLAVMQNYHQGKKLFVEVFSQYGPFYTQYYHFLAMVIPGSLTHNGLGWVTVAHWSASALLAGIVGQRLSGQLAVAVMCILASAFAMYDLRTEPGHPVSLCLLLIMLLLSLVPRPHSRWVNLRLFGAGAIVGALCLTKINLGVFTGMAVLLPLLVFGPARWLRLTGVLVSCLAACLPIFFIGLPWSRRERFALILPVTTGAVMLAAGMTATLHSCASRYRQSHVINAGVGCLAMLGLSLAVELVRGTPATVLWDGIISRPLELPGVFFAPPWGAGFIAAYAGALLTGMSLWWFGTRARSVPAQGMCALGVLIWIMTLYLAEEHVPRFIPGMMSAMAAPLGGVVMMAAPQRAADKALYAAISGVVLWTLLSLYPVCGAQMAVPAGLGAAVLPALVAACLSAGWRYVTRPWQVIGQTISWAGVCVAIAVSLRVAVINTKDYQSHVPLSFVGASWFRLAPVRAAELQALVANVRRHGSALITQPGLGSFYPWTGIDYPSGYLTTLYSKLLRPAELEHNLSQFPPQRSFLAVYSKNIMRFWLRGQDDSSDPVSSWLMTHTWPVYSGPMYQLRASTATPGFEPVYVAEIVAPEEQALVSVTLPVMVVEKALFMEIFSKGSPRSVLQKKVEWVVNRPVDDAWSRVQFRLPWQALKALQAADGAALWLGSHAEPWLAGIIVARENNVHGMSNSYTGHGRVTE